MKQMLMGRNTSYLSQEVITEILKRLPVKSLIRFQSVCKYWKNLIKSPSFINDHLHHSARRNPSLLIRYDCYLYAPFNLRLLDCEMQVRQVHRTPLIGSLSRLRNVSPSICDRYSWQLNIIGSTNGLLCVAFDGRLHPPLLLWNPATMEVRKVHKSRNFNHFKWYCWEGFGYSSVLNDYKIVRIYDEPCCVISGAEVCSLSTNSWKKIELGDLEGLGRRSFLHLISFSIDGSIFWYGVNGGGDNIKVIISYDIGMEVFKLIPLPLLISSCTMSFSIKLTLYDDKLALLSNVEKRTLIDLWVLEKTIDESAKTWSWIKKCSSSLYSSASMSLGTIWRNQIVCVLLSKHQREDEMDQNDEQKVTDLYLFDIITDKFKMFVIPKFGEAYSVINHVESLISPFNIHIEQP